MSRIHPQTQIYQKSRGVGKDREWLGRVVQLPCVICEEFGVQQLSPTQAHHCICGRYSFAKAPDRMTIPLCEGHHQGLRDTTKIAIHQGKETWVAEYGPDTDWLSWVESKIEELT